MSNRQTHGAVLEHYFPVDAYRADLLSAAQPRLGDDDELWVAVATVLGNASGLPVAMRVTEGIRYLREITGRSQPSALSRALVDTLQSTEAAAALASAILTVAEDMEDRGAYALAATCLELGTTLVGLGEHRLHGRFLTQRARILRKLGELESATDLYTHVYELGVEFAEPELRARGALGQGIIARMRGNYPLARSNFERVLSIESNTLEIEELHGLAHHGLLIAAAVAEDFDTALRHGIIAYEAAAEGSERQTEMLMNLAEVCYSVGQYRAALDSSLLVLSRSRLDRVRIAAFGGAARAAARLGLQHEVRQLVTAGDRVIRTSRCEYECADTEQAFAEALFWLGDAESGDAFRARAVKRARRNEFFEILLKSDELTGRVLVRQEPCELSLESIEVANSLVRPEHELLLAEATTRSG